MNGTISYTMCFSTTASFTASAALSATGAVTISKAARSDKKLVAIASVPLWFGVQQFAEGVVWFALTRGDVSLATNASYMFIFFANIWWPAFVPFAVSRIETDPKHKRMLHQLHLAGLFVGLYGLYFLAKFAVVPDASCKHIVYGLTYPYPHVMVILYVSVICMSFFISTSRFLRAFGASVFLSLIAAYYFYTAAFVSTWCFFAAILSIAIYSFIAHSRKSEV